MKSLLLAVFMLCHFNVVAQAQSSKAPATKKAPAQKGVTTKTVTTGKNSFTTTTTTTTEVPAKYPQQNYAAPVVAPPAPSGAAQTTSTTAAPATPTSAVAAASPAAPAAPAEPPTPWKLSYFGEYYGPRLSNIDLSKNQGPEAAEPGWGWIDHSLKIGYQVHKNHIIGTQIRAQTPFDPEGSFGFKNTRLYGTWSNMVDTSDLNLKTVLDIEFPTSDSARWKGNIINFNIKLNWELKTQLRNWSFTAMTMIRPMFWESPTNLGGTGKQASDIYFGLFPWITYDFAPSWTFVYEGSFDASHSYQDNFFNLGSDDPDYMRFGVQYAFNSHIQVNPAFQFYTGNFSFKAATLYMSLSAAL